MNAASWLIGARPDDHVVRAYLCVACEGWLELNFAMVAWIEIPLKPNRTPSIGGVEMRARGFFAK